MALGDHRSGGDRMGYGGYRYFAADDPPPEEPVASGQEVPERDRRAV